MKTAIILAALCFVCDTWAYPQLRVDVTQRVEARRGDRLCFELLGLVQGSLYKCFTSFEIL